VENQLSLILNGLSPLTTGLPRLMQQPRVRSSSQTINLPIVRSISFGSNTYNFLSISLSLQKLKLAIDINSLAHYAKGTLSLML